MNEDDKSVDPTEMELRDELHKQPPQDAANTADTEPESVIVQEGFADETAGEALPEDDAGEADDEQGDDLASFVYGGFSRRLDTGMELLEDAVESVKQQASNLVHGTIGNLDSFLRTDDGEILLPGGVSPPVRKRLDRLAAAGSRRLDNMLFDCASSLAAQSCRKPLVPFGANLSVASAVGEYEESDVLVAVGKGGNAQVKIGDTVFPPTTTKRLLAELLVSGNLELTELTIEIASMDDESDCAPFQVNAEGNDNCAPLLALTVGHQMSFAEQTESLNGVVETARAKLSAAELSVLPPSMSGVNQVSGTVQARKDDEAEGGYWLSQLVFHGDCATVVMAGFDEDGQRLDDDQEEQKISIPHAAKLLSDYRRAGWELRIMENSECRKHGVLDSKECRMLIVHFTDQEEETRFASIKDFVKTVRSTMSRALLDSLPANMEALAAVRDDINGLIEEFSMSDYGAEFTRFLEVDSWDKPVKSDKKSKKGKKNKKGKKGKKVSSELTAHERTLVARSKLPESSSNVLVLAKRRLNPQSQ